MAVKKEVVVPDVVADVDEVAEFLKTVSDAPVEQAPVVDDRVNNRPPQNRKGEYVVFDKDGNEWRVLYAVDAREMLRSGVYFEAAPKK